MAQQQPIKKFKLGSIQASIWVHENGQRRKRYTVAVSRSYQNKEGSWVNCDFFDHDDLPVVAKAMDFAYSWIWRRQIDERAKTSNEA